MKDFLIKLSVFIFILIPVWVFIDWQFINYIGKDQANGFFTGKILGFASYYVFSLFYSFIDFVLGYREAERKMKDLAYERAVLDHVFDEIKEKMNEKRN